MMREMPTARKTLRIALFYLMLLIIVLFTILPFLWMLSSSFKGSEAIRTIPIRWIPERPTLEGYQKVFHMQGFSFARSSLNSLLLAIACTIVAVGSAAMAAFVFAKLPFRGSSRLFGLYLATMMIPGTVTMVPNYIILRTLSVAFGLFFLLIWLSMLTPPLTYIFYKIANKGKIFIILTIIIWFFLFIMGIFRIGGFEQFLLFKIQVNTFFHVRKLKHFADFMIDAVGNQHHHEVIVGNSEIMESSQTGTRVHDEVHQNPVFRVQDFVFGKVGTVAFVNRGHDFFGHIAECFLAAVVIIDNTGGGFGIAVDDIFVFIRLKVSVFQITIFKYVFFSHG